jgi:hypothetical protein
MRRKKREFFLFLLLCGQRNATFEGCAVRVRRDCVEQNKGPGREEILSRMWQLANTEITDAVRLLCRESDSKSDGEADGEADGKSERKWDDAELNLDLLTELRLKQNGSIEMKFADRIKLLERLLDETKEDGTASAPSGAAQVEGFLTNIEEQREQDHGTN